MNHAMPLFLIALCGVASTGCNDAPVTIVQDEGRLVGSAEAGDVRMQVHAESLDAEAGEPIELLVTIEAPPDQRASLVIPEDDMIGDFEIIRAEDARDAGTSLAVAERHRILISTFESGDVVLPPLHTRYGNDSVLKTEPIPFAITSLLDEEFNPSNFDDIRGAVDDSTAKDQATWTYYAIGAGVVIVVACLAIALILGMRRRIRPRIPHEWALAELARIESEGPPGAGETTGRLERVETVLRWYVAFRFDIDAPDLTSNELVESVVMHEGIDDSARAVLERLVRAADQVKFAAGVATREDCVIALESARNFVLATIPSSEGTKEDAA